MNSEAERAEDVVNHLTAIRHLAERDQRLLQAGVTNSPERHEAYNRSILEHLAAIDRVIAPPPTVVGLAELGIDHGRVPHAGRINGGQRPDLRIVRNEEGPQSCP